MSQSFISQACANGFNASDAEDAIEYAWATAHQRNQEGNPNAVEAYAMELLRSGRR